MKNRTIAKSKKINIKKRIRKIYSSEIRKARWKHGIQDEPMWYALNIVKEKIKLFYYDNKFSPDDLLKRLMELDFKINNEKSIIISLLLGIITWLCTYFIGGFFEFVADFKFPVLSKETVLVHIIITIMFLILFIPILISAIFFSIYAYFISKSVFIDEYSVFIINYEKKILISLLKEKFDFDYTDSSLD